MSEDKAGLIVNAIGVAVLEFIGERMPITRDNLVEKLELNRRETGNMIRKGVKRDAADLLKNGNKKPGTVAGF